MIKYALLFCLTLLLVSESKSQNFCNTPSVELSDWITDMKARKVYPDFSKKLNTRSTKYIPIHYHIVTKSDGSGGFPLYWVMKMHYEINRNYRKNNVGVQFYLDSISYLHNDSYYNIGVGTNDDDKMAAASNTRMSCNVFLVNNPKGACGYTQRPLSWNTPSNRSSIYVAASYSSFNCSEPGSITLSHEMGHWLDLPHTFNGWEGFTYGSGTQPPSSRWEKVARTGTNSNCRTRGDGFCDTDPDYVSDRWVCPNSKIYTDPTGATFKLDPTNYMCYTSDSCSYKFTAEQIIQVNNCFTAFNERSDFLNLIYPDYGVLDTFKNYGPKTIKSTERLVKDQLKFIFDKKDNAQKYLFTLFKGNSSYSANYKVYPVNIILDTFITSNEFTLPSSIVLSELNWYYWTVQPVNKTNQFDYGIPLQGFRIGAIDLKAIGTSPNCAPNKGKVTFVNNSGDPSFQYSIDGTTFINDTVIESLDSGVYEAYFKKSNGTVYKIPVSINSGYKVTGKAVVNKNAVVASALSGKAPYTYKWSTGSTKSSLTLDSGDYELTITDANGCLSDIIEVKVASKITSGPSSILNFDQLNKIRIYPTVIEFGEKITIDNIKNSSFLIEVYSIDGKLVNSQYIQPSQGKATYEWTQKTQGIYLLKVKNESEEYSFKIQSK